MNASNRPPQRFESKPYGLTGFLRGLLTAITKKGNKIISLFTTEEYLAHIKKIQTRMNAAGMVAKLFYDRIREYLSILVKKANLRKRIEDLKGKIMSLTNFTIDQRLMLVKLVERWIDDCRVYGVKSITLLTYDS